MPRIQLVCFDLGGVLLRLCNGWGGALGRAGLTLQIADRVFYERRAFQEVNHAFERGEIEQANYADRVAGMTGLSPNDVLAVLDAWLVEPYPGIDAMLDQLEATSVRTACLSNTNQVHWGSFTSPGPLFLPLYRLDYRFASPFIGHRKPDAAIYRYVQAEAGLPPGAILFFDDTPENVRTATAIGWQAHLIDPLGDPIGQVTQYLRGHRVL